MKEPRTAAEQIADRTLVASCLKGDEEAWAELWARYGPVVKGVARGVGCDSEEAKAEGLAPSSIGPIRHPLLWMPKRIQFFVSSPGYAEDLRTTLWCAVSGCTIRGNS